MEVASFIIEKAKERGFCDVGFCSAEPFDFLRPKLERTQDILKGFVEADIEKRIDPMLTMPDAKSIIVLAKSYNKKLSFDKDSLPRGYISVGAVGEDYHTFMERQLECISKEFSKNFDGQYMVFSDTGPLCDRELALRSGIGYLGRNGSVITKNGGTMTFIGYILTSLEISFGQAEEKSCGNNCKQCVQSCPTGAINETGFSIEKCISYLTQVKRNLSLEEAKLIGGNLYGCDVCHKVCPQKGDFTEDLTEIDEIMPKIEDILLLSNKAFKEKYGGTTIGWRGNSVIKRNALAVLGNIKHKNSLEILKKYAISKNDFIRYGAISGIINLGTKEGNRLLRELYTKEKNAEIREVIKWAIGIPEG